MRLTERELEVAWQLGVECRSNKGAARVLGISNRTVEVHRVRIYKKLGARNAAHFVRLFNNLQ